MSRPRILYSTNTSLAYKISVRYYGNIHYVHVSPRFGSTSLHGELLQNPATSRPKHRYKILHKEVSSGDRHGLLIKENRVGLLKGTEEKFKSGVITEQLRDDIRAMVELAYPAEFRPLMYIMAYSDVEHLLKHIPVARRASATSEEWLIEELPGSLFDVVDWD